MVGVGCGRDRQGLGVAANPTSVDDGEVRPPRTIAVVVVEDFQLLDLAGPVDVFRMATRFGVEPAYELLVASPDGGPVRAESGVQVVPDELRSTGQGLLAAIGIGLGGILSNLACGWLFDRVGAQATYLGCGLGALLLGLATPLVLPRTGREHAAARGADDAAVDLGV